VVKLISTGDNVIFKFIIIKVTKIIKIFVHTTL
jgi:hypothetical protein